MMPAGKHFDPVLGVDIHIIQPPGPVPPLPVPHPFVGFLIDPMDYVPILGGTVEVNGMKRGVAGTAGKCVPPHIPIGGVFVKPPANECEVFMGSMTVAFDGDPATRMAEPVLSCHDIGMPPIPRFKRGGKIKSMVLPTSVLLPIPAGPPVLIGGPPTISLMAMGMKLGMAALGKAFRRLARTNLARRVGAAFRRARQRLFRRLPPGRLKCNILRAEPVDCTTGEVVVDQQDFELPGSIPLEWNRHYGSQSRRRGLCGIGWETPADARLAFEADGTVTFHDGGGTITVFEGRPVAGPVRDPVDGAVLSGDGTALTVRTRAGLAYQFTDPQGAAREAPVELLADRCGNPLRFVRNGADLLAILDNTGRRVDVQCRSGLIESLTLRHPDEPEPRVLARYAYGPAGDLVAVFDAHGYPYRFAYEGHRLVKLTDRNTLSFYYEYDTRAEPPRCVHTWGDGGLYDYRFEFLDVLGETRITDSLGHVTTLAVNEFQLPVRETDPLGGVTEYEYDEAGRPSAVVDPAGNRTEYEYDPSGNLLRMTWPDGVSTLAKYNERHLPVEVIDANGNLWRQEWDACGLLRSHTAPTGAVTRYDYDERGLLTLIISPLGAVTRLTADRYGNTSSVINALGHQTRFTFDALGNLTSQNDPTGAVTGFSYDAKSRLTGVLFPSGAKIEFGYDRQDNLILQRDEDGHVTHLDYYGLGELAQCRRPDGTSVVYRYDTEERLIGVTNERGENFRLTRDPLGRVVEETDYWGRFRAFQYNAAGDVVQTRDALGRVVHYKTDPLGRVTAVRLPSGSSEEYVYDPSGNVTAASGPHGKVERILDPEGRVLEERQGAFVVTNAYDLNGNRVRRTTSHGNTVTYEYDLLNQVSAIGINGAPPVRLERDAIGQVTAESLTANWRRMYRYDADGFLVRRQASFARGPSLDEEYEYDPCGNLVRRATATRGAEVFLYDAAARVREHTDPRGIVRKYFYDPAGDLLRSRSEERDGVWERVATGENLTCRFDAAGNLIERQDCDRRTLFDWDANNRLARSWSDSGPATTYGYDPEGRRLFKVTGGARVGFHWDGDALLADQVPGGGPREFVYYPDTFEPLAVINPDKRVQFYHNDPNGLPRECFDAAGAAVWSGSYTALGGIETLWAAEAENPLRLQGQYFDAETGLSYNRHRYYDPRAGSFISPDPLGLVAGENLYRFAPNVWAWIDPLGLSCQHADIVAKRREARRLRREAKSRAASVHPDVYPPGHPRAGQPHPLAGQPTQKPSGEGTFRNRAEANKGPGGVRPKGPDRKHGRQRNVGVGGEEHTRVAKGAGGRGARGSRGG